MATYYRTVIDSGCWMTRHRVQPHTHRTVARRSKREDRATVQQFLATLSHTVPYDGAVGYAEVSTPRLGTSTLLRVRGRTTTTRLGRDGYCRVPAGGEWYTDNGTIVAVAK